MRSALLSALFVVSSLAVPLGAQVPGSEGPPPLKVFLDCQASCDRTYILTEITWVDWVRDREDSDIHLLITSEATGGGGRRYVLAFLDRGEGGAGDHETSYTSSGDATRDETRAGLNRVMGLGLARFAEGTAAGPRLSVLYEAPTGGPGADAPPPDPTDDPWDFWVFQVGLNGNWSGESAQSFSSTSTSVSANRTTEAWKLNLRASYNKNVSTFELSGGKDRFVREDWNVTGLLVKSLSDHWSAGVRAATGSSTFFNQDFRWNVRPGIEYNFFPYSETARRELTLQYLLGVNYWDYSEETLFGQTEETRASHSLTLGLDLTQPWGQTNLSVSASQYFHDTSKYNAGIFGSINVRLFRGFSLRVSGTYSRVRDQLSIRKGNASDDEILTRQRELATNYRFFTSMGISYRFGSIFNNVVNPRFGGGGGGMVIFF